MSDPANPAPLVCGFCAKTQSEVKKLIAGHKGNICDECTTLCMSILAVEDLTRFGLMVAEALEYVAEQTKPENPN